jgi:hypothetical protein
MNYNYYNEELSKFEEDEIIQIKIASSGLRASKWIHINQDSIDAIRHLLNIIEERLKEEGNYGKHTP